MNTSVQLIVGKDSLSPPPRVRIPLAVFQKLKCFIELCPYEVNGLGRVERKANDFFVSDIFLLKQYTQTPALQVETDSRALNEYVYHLVQNGGDPRDLVFQWHSHADCHAFFSCTDVSTIREYQSELMISFVMNRRLEYECRLDIYQPVKLSVSVPVVIVIPAIKKKEKEFCQKQIEKNVIAVSSKEKESPQDENAAPEIPVQAPLGVIQDYPSDTPMDIPLEAFRKDGFESEEG